MFKKWGTEPMNTKTEEANRPTGTVKAPNSTMANKSGADTTERPGQHVVKRTPKEEPRSNKANTILKGSSLSGDINVTCDLDLSGDIEGNITSEKDSNIIIRGLCKGNIKTNEGNVEIMGELRNGNITAGKDITVTGKFNGGVATAKGKIYVDGEFNGKLEANEIEIGPNSHGKGELFYKEYIAVARGARVEVQISRMKGENRDVKSAPEKKAGEVKPPAKESHPVTPEVVLK